MDVAAAGGRGVCCGAFGGTGCCAAAASFVWF